jgi:hypothetical protein
MFFFARAPAAPGDIEAQNIALLRPGRGTGCFLQSLPCGQRISVPPPGAGVLLKEGFSRSEAFLIMHCLSTNNLNLNPNFVCDITNKGEATRRSFSIL